MIAMKKKVSYLTTYALIQSAQSLLDLTLRILSLRTGKGLMLTKASHLKSGHLANS